MGRANVVVSLDAIHEVARIAPECHEFVGLQDLWVRVVKRATLRRTVRTGKEMCLWGTGQEAEVVHLPSLAGECPPKYVAAEHWSAEKSLWLVDVVEAVAGARRMLMARDEVSSRMAVCLML